MASDSKRMILAVTLSGLILFTWQAYFAPKNMNYEQNTATTTTAETKTETAVRATDKTAVPTTTQKQPEAKQLPAYAASTELLSKAGVEYKISSDLVITGTSNPRAVYDYVETTGSDKPLKIQVVSGTNVYDLRLNFTKEGDVLKGTDANLGINFTASLSDDGKLFYSFKSDRPYVYRVQFSGAPKELNFTQKRDFILYSKDVERITVGDDDSGEGKIVWSGIDFNYHLLSFVNVNPQAARYKMYAQGEGAIAQIDYVNPATAFDGYVIYAKKNYDQLAKLGDNLQLSVDFGFFGIIAVPILRGLQFFYKYIPNYGIAIILLTILIRLLTFPLQFKSFKSMKKMQDVQPELQKIREKYKDDPQRLQRESMELFKRAGANPLGGCLPLLMQMPILIAFYQVLYNAVELVGAPFYFWITDLSIKDPYYLLPVLMGISMFFQSKINPSPSADPTQKKVMMFMPLIFTFFMKDLPAGLNLYIFVSTLFGIIQQLFVYRVVK